MNIHNFNVPDEALARIAAGRGDLADIDRLRAGQHSKRMIQLELIAELASPHVLGGSPFSRGLDILRRLHSSYPGILNPLISSPQMAAWTSSCLRQLARSGERQSRVDRDVRPMLDRLATVGAAAAILCGEQLSIDVPLLDGDLYLPTLGYAHQLSDRLRQIRNDGYITVTVTQSSVLLQQREISKSLFRWYSSPVVRPWRSIDPDLTVELCLHDPLMRAGSIGRMRPTTNGPPDRADRWLTQLYRAVELLTSRHQQQVPTIAGLVRAIIPSLDDNRVRGSSTSRFVNGAVWATWTESVELLAEALIHESQHLKLSALHDLVPLVDDGGPSIRSPWSAGLRPPVAVLHGIFAFLSVIEFQLRESEFGVAAVEAGDIVAPRLNEIDEAMRCLVAAKVLTDAGLSIVESANIRRACIMARLG